MAAISKEYNYKDQGLLVIRVGLGLLFIYHGLPKLIGGPDEWTKIGGAMGNFGIHFLPVVWGLLCALIEAVGGLLIIFGIAFRPVCLLVVLNLIVAAIFTYEMGKNFGDATHALEDAVTFAGLYFIGPGKYIIGKFK